MVTYQTTKDGRVTRFQWVEEDGTVGWGYLTEDLTIFLGDDAHEFAQGYYPYDGEGVGVKDSLYCDAFYAWTWQEAVRSCWLQWHGRG